MVERIYSGWELTLKGTASTHISEDPALLFRAHTRLLVFVTPFTHPQTNLDKPQPKSDVLRAILLLPGIYARRLTHPQPYFHLLSGLGQDVHIRTWSCYYVSVTCTPKPRCMLAATKNPIKPPGKPPKK